MFREIRVSIHNIALDLFGYDTIEDSKEFFIVSLLTALWSNLMLGALQ